MSGPAPVVTGAESGQSAALFGSLASFSRRMHDLFRTCARVAGSTATVLIQGETGTGKELVARAIHERSGRTGHFVAIDCGAIQESLFESELFGHERGAFTGAVDRRLGLLRHAAGGTLLLDEVGNLPLASQHSLLRVLQERRLRPVGGTKEVEIDVRIMAASSACLATAVAEGRFREDLLYRLDVIRLDLPPLRERPLDVLHLFQLFLDRLASRYDLDPINPGAGFLGAAVECPWPGNVRQLENLAERVSLAGLPCLSARDFHAGMLRSPACGVQAPTPVGREAALRDAASSSAAPGSQSLGTFLEQQEAHFLRGVLRQTEGSLAMTAAQAGIDPRTLRRKLKRHGIDWARYRPDGD